MHHNKLHALVTTWPHEQFFNPKPILAHSCILTETSQTFSSKKTCRISNVRDCIPPFFPAKGSRQSKVELLSYMHEAATGAKLDQKGNERSEVRSLFCALTLLLSLVFMIADYRRDGDCKY